MRRFSVKNLPSKVLKRIDKVEFCDDLDWGSIGLVWLKDEYEFEDGSHVDGFSSRDDLIERVMESERARK